MNIVTGETMSFQEAMGMGDIIVEFKSQKKIREEKSSYGIITVKTSVETRPYTVTGAIDPKTEMELNVDEAYKKGTCTHIDSSQLNILKRVFTIKY